MGKLAIVSPGQGSQSVGMGQSLSESNAAAREAFAKVDASAGRALSTLCFEGPEAELKRTINTQPTILAASLAAWAAYESAGGPKPDFVAGHSLGEITALCVSGVLTLDDAVKLVEKRASLMENCPKGAMSAVLGMDDEKLQSTLSEVSEALKAEGRLLIAGPNPLPDNPERFSGSLIVAQFASLDDAQSWAEQDPYVDAGVYDEILIKPFKAVFK